MSLASIRQSVVRCARCPRLRRYCERVALEKKRAYRDETYWGRPVPGFGDPDAQLLVVGLAPAAHGGNRTGRVFTGDSSGDFLMRALHKARFASLPTSTHVNDGLQLSGAYIAAAVRCAPWLAAELDALPRVRVVVALGRIAFDASCRLLRARGRLDARRPVFGHGVVHRAEGELALVASYHPSRQNTNTGRLTEEMFDRVFAQARELL